MSDIDFELTARDTQRLAGVHPSLRDIVVKAAKYTDMPFVVFEGLRTKKKQAEYVKRGVSKTMNSRHLIGLAVDLVPLLPAKKGSSRLVPKWDGPSCKRIASAMMRAASELDIHLEWGGDWRFYDAAHYQLHHKSYPYKAHPHTEQFMAGSKRAGRTTASLDNVARVSTNSNRGKDAKKYPGGASKWIKFVQGQINSLAETGRVDVGAVLEEDGLLGPVTNKAIRQVQKTLGLEDDGMWGPVTDIAVRAAIQKGGKLVQKEANKATAALNVPKGSQETEAKPDVVPEAQDAGASGDVLELDNPTPTPTTLTGAQDMGNTDQTPPTQEKGFMDGKKTYIIAAITAVLAVLEGILGFDIPGVDIPADEVINYILGALGLGALRSGVAKKD